MRIVVTGGGTGGHIYPALEVARRAELDGAEILYLGSLRGQEGAICERLGIRFAGFPSEPLYSLRSARGWRAAAQLLRATGLAKTALRAAHPDAVFSTGGYSAAPVMAAARSLRILYVIHEANSVPGRSNRMFRARAFALTYVFRATGPYARGHRAERTGQPIRNVLRAATQARNPLPNEVLVVGGSQGSVYLNALTLAVAHRLPDVRFRLAAGPKNAVPNAPSNVEVSPFLDADALIAAYQRATLAMARSGGILAEFAMFGLPSVLVPLPSAADQHQLRNAEEFVQMGAASIVAQPADAQVTEAQIDQTAQAIRTWIDDPERRQQAANALAEWDVPDATDRVYAQVRAAF